jgi:hypothetical protein
MKSFEPVAIRQTLRGVTAHTLNSDGTYNRCVVNNEQSQGDVIHTAILLAAFNFGYQFRLDLMGARPFNSHPVDVAGVACTVGAKWDIIPFDSLISIPYYRSII